MILCVEIIGKKLYNKSDKHCQNNKNYPSYRNRPRFSESFRQRCAHSGSRQYRAYAEQQRADEDQQRRQPCDTCAYPHEYRICRQGYPHGCSLGGGYGFGIITVGYFRVIHNFCVIMQGTVLMRLFSGKSFPQLFPENCVESHYQQDHF